MSKLSNGTEYYNSFFHPVFGEYLIQNGFVARESTKNLFFENAKFTIVVMHANIDVFTNHPEEKDPSKKYQFFKQVNGLELCTNIFDFMNLMSVDLVVPINEFVGNAYKLGEQEGTEARFLVNALRYCSLSNAAI